MKKILLTGLFFITFLFIGVIGVSAEEEVLTNTAPTVAPVADAEIPENRRDLSPINKRESVKNNYKERVKIFVDKYRNTNTNNASTTKAEVKERIDAKKQDVRERLINKQRERVSAQIEKMVSRFEKVLEKIDGAKDRVKSRIEKMEEKGIDMTKPKALLVEVPIKIDEAKKSIEQMSEALKVALNSETLREAFGEIRGLVSETKESIKIAHKSLVDVIISIKASVKTTTEENKTNEDSDN